jgi:hypothetical protein
MVIDPDEIIMPQLGTSVNLSQLMSRLEQEYSRSRPSNYVFWNVYHFTDGSPNIRESPYLTILRYPMKTPLSEYGRGFKSIIDPRACVHMHNQYCWGVTPGLTKSGQSYFEVVNPDIAVKHTYRYDAN